MQPQADKSGKLVIISGPSGVGKSTISRRIIEKLNAFYSVSMTTRPKGAGEEDGKDYWFVSHDEFKQKIREDGFLEYAELFGEYYGTPREPAEAALAEGRIVLLEIDVQGCRQVMKYYPDAVSIFILPPHKEELLKRMDRRGRGESDAARSMRLEQAGREIAAAFQRYKFQVINENLDSAVQEVIDIIEGKFGE